MSEWVGWALLGFMLMFLIAGIINAIKKIGEYNGRR